MTETDASPQAPNRVPYAAALYFALVFAAGVLLGPVRVIWIEPWLGNTLAVVLEAPFLIAAIWFASRAAPKWAGVSGGWTSFLMIGVVALIMQQIADLAVGFGLRGMTFQDQMQHFTTPAGMIYAVTLLIFTLMPLIRMWRPGRTT
ncbi:MAG: hypothetical protein KF779_01935 [Hyphomonadaceae bacterium]|nr:hypothetical protein [Hyphomonadaceae bacterium]